MSVWELRTLIVLNKFWKWNLNSFRCSTVCGLCVYVMKASAVTWDISLFFLLTFNQNQYLSLNLIKILLFPKPQTGVWTRTPDSGITVWHFVCLPSSSRVVFNVVFHSLKEMLSPNIIQAAIMLVTIMFLWKQLSNVQT